MHYAPPESRFDDEEAQTLGGSSGGSRGSSSRKSRSSRGNSRGASKTRRNNNINNNNTRYQQRPPQHHHQQQQKMVQKNLGKFIKRSFAKPKPGPHPEALRLAAAAADQSQQQQSQTSTAPQIIGENSYLLPLEGGLINCRPSSQYGDGDRAPLTSPAMSYMTVDSHTNDPHTNNNMQYPSHASVGSGSASTGRRSSKGLMSSITHKLHRQSQQQQQQPSSPDRSSASAPTRGSTKKKHFRFFDDHHHEYPTEDGPPSISTMEAGSWHDHHTGDDTHSSHHDDDDDDDDIETEEERALRIARAQDEIRSHMSFSVGHCLMAIFVYVVLSIVCFSFFLEQEWTFLTSSYFAVVTFTTIGYGDVVPDTMKARLFTCVWSISGVAFLGIALGVIGSNLIEGAHDDRKKAQVQRQSKVIGLFDHYDTTTSSATASNTPTSQQRNKSASYYSTIEEGKRRVMFDQFRDSGDDADDDEEGCQTHCSWTKTIVVVRRLVLVSLIVGILYTLSVCEKWNLVQTVYYAIITATTVGYGDFSPKTETGRALAVIFIPLAVSTMGTFLGAVANTIITYRQKRYANFLQSKPLTIEDIKILDGDGDGNVTRAEFFEFMLVAMNQVDKSLFDGLNEHFDRLDTDKSGTLNKDDLATMAKHQILRKNNDDVLAGSFRLANYREYQQQPTEIATRQSKGKTRLGGTKRNKSKQSSF